MKLRKDAKYALVVPTSMGIRLTPFSGAPVHTSDIFQVQVTSAESNVASVPASLGMPTKVLTAFVKDSPISAMIKSNLKSRHMEYEGPEMEQGGPWGLRHQFNIADSGYGVRGPRVHNDRAGEVGRNLNVKDFDLDKLFGQDGVKMLHLSGLIAALSPETGEFCLALAKKAKTHGTAISFDLNHRASFWINREKELSDIFARIAAVSDVLLGNEEDFQLALGIHGPESGGADLSEKLDSFQTMIAAAKEAYPNTSVFATTLRQVISANEHLWGGVMTVDGSWHTVSPKPITVLDRIGGGDGFVGGLLYAILKGWPPEKWLQFGWATGAMATTVMTDYILPADEEQIWSIWQGNARVRR